MTDKELVQAIALEGRRRMTLMESNPGKRFTLAELEGQGVAQSTAHTGKNVPTLRQAFERLFACRDSQ